MVVHVQDLTKYDQAIRIATPHNQSSSPAIMEPPNGLSTETKLNFGKQKKDAGDKAFRQGDTKEGMCYISDLVLVTVKFSAMKQYHEVTRISN